MNQKLLKILEFIPRHQVKRLFRLKQPIVVAVTGTVGKTSTKVMIGRVLSAVYKDKKVEYSLDSYNSPIGLPLSIFGLKVPDRLSDLKSWLKIFREINKKIKDFNADILVIEVAEDEPGSMPSLMKIIKPDIMVITAISLAHTARTTDEENILNNIKRLTQYAKVIIKNNDFELLKREIRGSGFGMHEPIGRWGVRDLKRDIDNSLIIRLIDSGDAMQQINIPTSMIGEHNIYAVLAALAVLQELDNKDALAEYGVLSNMKSELRPMNGRMNLLRGINDSSIIDDSYNAASPIGVVAALNTLTYLSAKRKIAVLGNMNELGGKSAGEHTKIGEYAVDKADIILFLGPDMSKYAFEKARELLGKDDSRIIKKFNTPYEVGEYLHGIIRKGDLILVKGSQNNVFSEEVIKYILDPRLNLEDVLVRQSDSWIAKKKIAFRVK